MYFVVGCRQIRFLVGLNQPIPVHIPFAAQGIKSQVSLGSAATTEFKPAALIQASSMMRYPQSLLQRLRANDDEHQRLIAAVLGFVVASKDFAAD